MWIAELLTYLLGWDLDTDLLDGLSKFIRLDGAVVVKVEVLESLLHDGLLRLSSLGLLSKFVFKFSLETEQERGGE